MIFITRVSDKGVRVPRVSDKGVRVPRLFIKRYGIESCGYSYKVVFMKSVREKGWEDCIGDYCIEDRQNYVNDDSRGECEGVKLANNLSRARSRIYELASCNKWDWFITATLDPDKYDRSDLKKYRKDFSQFIRDQRKKYNVSLKYLLIPELHADGENWHMHGLLSGLSDDMVSDFPIGSPVGLIENGYKNWLDYSKKFGWVSLGPIKNHSAVSKYITKYITKDMGLCVSELGSRLFYSSLGLKGSKEVYRGTLALPIDWDYENEYCCIKWFHDVHDIPVSK